MLLRPDCLEFPGDRPCRPSKERGQECPDCPDYRPVGFRVLLVKLDAPGDVLRTTSVLEGLHRRHGPGLHLTWVTRPASLPLLERSEGIHRLLSTEDPLLPILLKTETFDLAAALDPSKDAAAIASAAVASQRRGFVLHPKGYVAPADAAASTWLEMGAFDRLKKANTRTCQDHLQSMLGLEGHAGPIRYTPGNAARAAAAAVPAGPPLVGFNTGAGKRWTYKKWTEEGWIALGRLLMPATRVALLGGPEEMDRNNVLHKALPGALRPGEGLSLDGFAGVLSRCDVVVTGDTLALHLAVALKRRVVALFGPTSATEVELYGLGEKLVADIPCQCCYLPDCDVRPTCMDRITPALLHAAVLRQLESRP